MRTLVFTVFAFLLCALVHSGEFAKMFAERAKCVVVVSFVMQTEENRGKFLTSGTVIDEKGLVLVPESEIPYTSLECLKDFKVFFYGGNPDGYPAKFLGSDSITGSNFLRIEGGTPKYLRPYTDFAKAEFQIGQDLWGILREPVNYRTLCYKSSVQICDKSALTVVHTQEPVSGTGSPVFDSEGRIVGIGLGNSVDSLKVLNLKDGTRIRVGIEDLLATSTFVSVADIEEIVKRVPSNPEGDPFGWLGLAGLQPLERDVAKFLGLEGKCALVISAVLGDSPAAKAGLKSRDIIVGINGVELERMEAPDLSLAKFSADLKSKKVGELIRLKIIRDSKPIEDVSVVLGKNPINERQAKRTYFKRLGFSVSQMIVSDAIARKMFDKLQDVAVVRFVRANSPASSATPSGLRSGDIIREINSVPVKTYKDALDALEKIAEDEKVKELVILSEGFRETKLVRIKLD